MAQFDVYANTDEETNTVTPYVLPTYTLGARAITVETTS